MHFIDYRFLPPNMPHIVSIGVFLTPGKSEGNRDQLFAQVWSHLSSRFNHCRTGILWDQIEGEYKAPDRLLSRS